MNRHLRDGGPRDVLCAEEAEVPSGTNHGTSALHGMVPEGGVFPSTRKTDHSPAQRNRPSNSTVSGRSL